MVASETTKQILHALANAIPRDGTSPVRSVRIHDRWGDMVFVAIHTHLSRQGAHELGKQLRESVEGALADRRHRVEIVWDSPG